MPPLVGPAVTAGDRGAPRGWADGLVTVNQPPETLRQVVDAYRDAGGRGQLALQVHLSWAPTDDEALRVAHDQWRSNVFGPPVSWDLETAEAFDTIGRDVTAGAGRRVRQRLVRPDPARSPTSSASTSSGLRRRSTCTTSVSEQERVPRHLRRPACLPQLLATAVTA